MVHNHSFLFPYRRRVQGGYEESRATDAKIYLACRYCSSGMQVAYSGPTEPCASPQMHLSILPKLYHCASCVVSVERIGLNCEGEV